MKRPQAPAICVRPPGWTSLSSQPFAAVIKWAQHAEALGFDGLFVGDRLLAEASQRDQVVYGASMLDATVVLAAIAASTQHLRLGPLVLVFPYRHPIQLAKTIASLDVASDGRLVLGAGIGWNQREFDVLGVPTAGRGQRFEADLALVRRLWRGDAVVDPIRGWDGEGVRISPLPVQEGGPPIWIASFSPDHALDWDGPLPQSTLQVLDRVGRLADGWVPLIYSASSKRRLDSEVLSYAWQYVLERAKLVGRTRADIEFAFSDWCYVLDGPAAVERCRQALARFFTGSWEEALRTYSIGTTDSIVSRITAHTATIDRVDNYILTPLSDELEQLELLTTVADGLRRG